MDNDRKRWIDQVNETAENAAIKEIMEQIRQDGLETSGKEVTIKIGRTEENDVKVEAFTPERGQNGEIGEKMVADMKIPFFYVSHHLEGIKKDSSGRSMLGNDVGDFLGHVEMKLLKGLGTGKESELVSEKTIYSTKNGFEGIEMTDDKQTEANNDSEKVEQNDNPIENKNDTEYPDDNSDSAE